MYDEVVNAAKDALAAELGLSAAERGELVVLSLSYSRDPDYWQVCLGLGTVDPWTVVLAQGARSAQIVRGRLGA